MSARVALPSKWLPQALLSRKNAANQIVTKSNPVIVTTSNNIGPVIAGVFMAAPSGTVKRATTGDTLTGWVNAPPTAGGTTPASPVQAGYIATSAAGQCQVLDLTTGPVFTMIDNTSTEASTLYGQAVSGGVDINSGGVYCDMVNGTDNLDTGGAGTAAPAPIGSVLIKSDTYATSAGSLQFRVLGLTQEPGNTSAPYKYDVICIKYQ